MNKSAVRPIFVSHIVAVYLRTLKGLSGYKSTRTCMCLKGLVTAVFEPFCMKKWACHVAT